MTDYSGTPLPKKLGIKEGSRLLFVDAPADFQDTLGALPVRVRMSGDGAQPLDVVLLFVKSLSSLEEQFTTLAARLQPAGMLWVAWPKKSSAVKTDLDFNAVQSVGLASGLVDNKSCAIDETWSAVRFVIRLTDRTQASKP